MSCVHVCHACVHVCTLYALYAYVCSVWTCLYVFNFKKKLNEHFQITSATNMFVSNCFFGRSKVFDARLSPDSIGTHALFPNKHNKAKQQHVSSSYQHPTPTTSGQCSFVQHVHQSRKEFSKLFGRTLTPITIGQITAILLHDSRLYLQRCN